MVLGKGPFPDKGYFMFTQIGFVSETGRGASDVVLADVAALLGARGVRLAGTVQSNTERPDRAHCDMDVRVLPDGPSFRISQDLGSQSRGCRLDPGALEQAVVAATARLDGAEVLIVNKFGKLETEGRGFCGLIAEALARDIPVVVGVNGLNRPAFETFADNMAEALGSDPQQIVGWILARLGKAAA